LSWRVAGDIIIKCFFGCYITETKLFGEPIAVGLSRFVSENSTQNATIWYMLSGAKFFDLGLRKSDRELNRKIAIIRSIGCNTVNTLV